MELCKLLKNFSFVVRLAAALLNSVSVCVWGTWGPGAVPPYNSPGGPLIFIHALSGCLFLLPVLLLAEALGEAPGVWTQRVVLLMGLVTLLPLGVIGIITSVKSGTAVQVSISTLCLAAGLLLLADFVFTEKLYCCFEIDSKAFT